MDTQVRTPQFVFMQPQRLVVPLFQRPYVWNQENQWEPLWQDVTRVAERVLQSWDSPPYPHFLGAVVLQKAPNAVGGMQEWVIIDGQQRLTTLQLMLDALHAQLVAVNAVQPASRIETLIANPEAFRQSPEDQFKVWPTNRDRPAFNEVMQADIPVDYEALSQSSARMVQAHRYFSEQAASWLTLNGEDETTERAHALERVARELLQMVVIELAVEENAQEIFETLNARGAQLTAADLIKNFVFQRLMEAGEPVEQVYESSWKEFETGFWETEISAGRLRYPRSAIFLNQWLVAKTGEEIVAREVFARFKSYADFDAEVAMPSLVSELHASSLRYRSIVEGAAQPSGPLDRLELFTYRTSALESEVVKPIVLFLVDPNEEAIPDEQIVKALDTIESWLVRRMLVRATTKSYTQVVAELITQIRKGDRAAVGDVVEEYFATATGLSRYWPDDDEVREEVKAIQAYRRLSRGRLRMVLEAVEDHLRGFRGATPSLVEERVLRNKYHIEHVMPRAWHAHWPIEGGPAEEVARDRLVHTFGNLTLLTKGLNTKVSNGPWLGDNGKKAALHQHDVLFLNRRLLDAAGGTWSDEQIRKRSERIAEIVLEIWPVPEGHRSAIAADAKTRHRDVTLVDLMNAGELEPGQTLYPRKLNPRDLTATLLHDGAIDVEGIRHETPSGAAGAIAGKHVNAWWYFLVEEPPSKRSLRKIWRDYVDTMSVEVDDDAIGLDDNDDD